jgi:hypothetical protein
MGLDPAVTALVLLAAVMHAGWNAVTKSSPDRTLTFALVLGTSALMGLVACCFVPPPAPEAIGFLLASACFHALYQIFLLQAYRFGDLSHVYPIARGLARCWWRCSRRCCGEAPDGAQALGWASRPRRSRARARAAYARSGRDAKRPRGPAHGDDRHLRFSTAKACAGRETRCPTSPGTCG